MNEFNPSLDVITYSELKEGISNLNLKINCKESDQQKCYGLRLCNPMFEDWKFDKEYKLLNYLSKHTKIPVPKVIFIDGTKKTIAFKFFITEFMPGKSLEEIESQLDFECLKTIFSELGTYLSELHKMKFKLFGGVELNEEKLQVGPLRDGGYCDGPFSRWDQSILSLNKYYLKKIRAIKPFRDLVNVCKKEIDTNYKIAKCDVPSLIHKNLYEKSNILIENNHISGLLDFEWAEAADSEYEITQIWILLDELSITENREQLWKSFLSKYEKRLTPVYEKKRTFYLFLEKIHFMNVWDFIKNKYTQREQKEIVKKTHDFVISCLR